MQLHIRHETLYRYDEPVKRSVQNLRLTPRRERVQRALSWHITAPGRQLEQVDAYGNVVHLLTVNEPHREIRIIVQGTVEIVGDDHAVLVDEGRLSPLAYLAETPLTRAEDPLVQFARARLPERSQRRDDILKLAEEVRSTIAYETGSTDVRESASQAFLRGKGVCQDHSHVFIACCRARGLPARYVSGYFYTGTPGQVASHAWADVWLEEEQGWVSIDVTHGTLAGTRHCRLAVGRDYLDACPVRGVRRGGGSEQMHVSVFVGTTEQQQQ